MHITIITEELMTLRGSMGMEEVGVERGRVEMTKCPQNEPRPLGSSWSQLFFPTAGGPCLTCPISGSLHVFLRWQN